MPRTTIVFALPLVPKRALTNVGAFGLNGALLTVTVQGEAMRVLILASIFTVPGVTAVAL